MGKNFDSLKSAIDKAVKKPKAIVVSDDLFDEMNKAGVIVKKMATPWGLDLDEDWQIEFPFYGDIIVHRDPFLDDTDKPFRLPPQS